MFQIKQFYATTVILTYSHPEVIICTLFRHFLYASFFNMCSYWHIQYSRGMVNQQQICYRVEPHTQSQSQLQATGHETLGYTHRSEILKSQKKETHFSVFFFFVWVVITALWFNILSF